MTHAIPQGIETADFAVEDGESDTTVPDTGSSSTPGGNEAADAAVSAEMVTSRHQRLGATLSGYRKERLKRKLSADTIAREDLDIKRRLLQRLEATDNEFVQAIDRWSSTMDRLNSNIELLVQHIVGSGTSRCTPPCPPSDIISIQIEGEHSNPSAMDRGFKDDTDL